MDEQKSPFQSEGQYLNAKKAKRRHKYLVEKGRIIAENMAIARQNSASTSIEKGEPWGTPSQAPYYGTGINVDKAIPFIQRLIDQINGESK